MQVSISTRPTSSSLHGAGERAALPQVRAPRLGLNRNAQRVEQGGAGPPASRGASRDGTVAVP